MHQYYAFQIELANGGGMASPIASNEPYHNYAAVGGDVLNVSLITENFIIPLAW